MPLLKIKDFDPDYKEAFGGYDIKGLNVYSEINGEKIGTVNDLLIDEQGRFRYFIVDLGFWGFGKKVLLPVGRSQIDSEGKHVHALGFTKDQAENLPEFSENLKIDNDYEDRVRGAYRPQPSAPPSQPMPPAGVPENIPMAGQVPPPPSPHGYAAPSAPAPIQPDYPQDRGYGQMGQPPVPASPSPMHSPQPVNRSVQPPVQSSQPPIHQQQPQQQWQPQQPPQEVYYASSAPGSDRPYGSSSTPGSDRPYDYRQEPELYEMDDQRHSILRRFEQRLQEKRMSGRR
jgi:stress response protein YsnF